MSDTTDTDSEDDSGAPPPEHHQPGDASTRHASTSHATVVLGTRDIEQDDEQEVDDEQDLGR